MYSVRVSRFFSVSVSTFGYLRIYAHLQLPAAFRSLSRPSSAPDAKAFALCSSSLELYQFSFLELLEFLEHFLFRFVNNSCEKVFSPQRIVILLLLNRFSPLGEIVLYPNWKDL